MKTQDLVDKVAKAMEEEDDNLFPHEYALRLARAAIAPMSSQDALIARVIRNYKRIQGNYGHTSTLPPDEAKRYWNEWQTEIDIAEGKQEA